MHEIQLHDDGACLTKPAMRVRQGLVPSHLCETKTSRVLPSTALSQVVTLTEPTPGIRRNQQVNKFNHRSLVNPAQELQAVLSW